jgi:hypothetical protein
MRKYIKFFRCGICGAKRPWEELGKHHDFMIRLQEVGDGLPFKWHWPAEGYSEFRCRLIRFLKRLLFDLENTPTICDKWITCSSCIRDESDCPDETARANQKSRRLEKEQAARTLAAQGLSTVEVARILGKPERTIRKHIRGK